MATRIFRQTFTNAGADTVDANEGPLTPPSGIKWTIVELRLAGGGAGKVECFFDTELYHTIDQEVTNQFGKPDTLALDIVQPHQYRQRFTDTSGGANNSVLEVVVEESPQSGA